MRKLMLTLVLVLVVSSGAFAAHIDSALQEAIGNAKGLIPVIVEMNPGAKHVDIQALGGKLGYTYTVINGFSAELPAQTIEALAKNPNVFAITYDREFVINLTIATCTVDSDDLWREGYDGSGVTIAIIDTGIYPHQDFQNRIIGFKDFINARTAPYDDNGHGTHMAGIAAGNGAIYDGPARDAKLVGVKVLTSSGSGTISNIINGINWCITNKSIYNIKVMNLSLGGSVTQSSTTDPLCSACRTAWNNGIVVSTTAGGGGSIGCPGNEPMVITTGATDDKGTCTITDDTIAPFTSRGPTAIDGWVKPDCVAPGVSITAADNAATGYVTMSGTSMSTALVSGVCAQVLEAWPTWTPSTVKSNLKGSCRSLGYDVYTQGAGLISAYYTVH